MSYRPDTLEGVIEFCDYEGQPCESVKRLKQERDTAERGGDFAVLAFYKLRAKHENAVAALRRIATTDVLLPGRMIEIAREAAEENK